MLIDIDPSVRQGMFDIAPDGSFRIRNPVPVVKKGHESQLVGTTYAGQPIIGELLHMATTAIQLRAWVDLGNLHRGVSDLDLIETRIRVLGP